MANYSYDADAKSRLRSAITAHPSWKDAAARHGISSSGLTVDLMEIIAGELSIDLSQYGKPRQRKPT